MNFMKLPSQKEVRTIDANLNFPIIQPVNVVTFEELTDTVHHLPEVDQSRHYLQLAVNYSEESSLDISGLPIILLGYDLSDKTWVSSILNCGPWTGNLLPFVDRLNGNGLLSFEDAINVQRIMPDALHDDPHSNVDIWAIYEWNQ